MVTAVFKQHEVTRDASLFKKVCRDIESDTQSRASKPKTSRMNECKPNKNNLETAQEHELEDSDDDTQTNVDGTEQTGEERNGCVEGEILEEHGRAVGDRDIRVEGDEVLDEPAIEHVSDICTEESVNSRGRIGRSESMEKSSIFE